MVEKNDFLYLLIGCDSLAKDIKLKKIRTDFFSSSTLDFNQDILHSRDLTLKVFQERILLLPAKAKRRLIIIRNAEELKEEIKEFILKELKEIKNRVILVLDINQANPRDDFLRQLSRFSQASYFGTVLPCDTFTLNKQIKLKRPDEALRILARLLNNGEKPERIMGWLRYVWEKDIVYAPELKKRLKLLLNCDLEIKRGRLKPDFALEKLVVSLCTFT